MQANKARSEYSYSLFHHKAFYVFPRILLNKFEIKRLCFQTLLLKGHVRVVSVTLNALEIYDWRHLRSSSIFDQD